MDIYYDDFWDNTKRLRFRNSGRASIEIAQRFSIGALEHRQPYKSFLCSRAAAADGGKGAAVDIRLFVPLFWDPFASLSQGRSREQNRIRDYLTLLTSILGYLGG